MRLCPSHHHGAHEAQRWQDSSDVGVSLKVTIQSGIESIRNQGVHQITAIISDSHLIRS